jgi:hypothetical protein
LAELARLKLAAAWQRAGAAVKWQPAKLPLVLAARRELE